MYTSYSQPPIFLIATLCAELQMSIFSHIGARISESLGVHVPVFVAEYPNVCSLCNMHPSLFCARAFVCVCLCIRVRGDPHWGRISWFKWALRTAGLEQAFLRLSLFIVTVVLSLLKQKYRKRSICISFSSTTFYSSQRSKSNRERSGYDDVFVL